MEVNPDLPMVPASVTKAVTSASALTQRAADSRFATEVVASGKIDSKGTLHGDIVVRAVGDPTIESDHFDFTHGFADSIAAAAKHAGINRVTGTVVIDESIVPHSGVPSGWADEDIVWPYGTSHHGANYRDNKFVLTMPQKKSVPFVPDLQVRHTPAKRSLTVDRGRDSEVIVAKGRVRKGGESVTLSIPFPAKVMRHDVMQRLERAGVKGGSAQKSDGGEGETLLYTYRSPELTDILRSLMFRSDNMMAESMLRSLAPGATREQAARSEIDMWELRDIDTDGIVLEDGSGLSRNDRLTPRFLADVFVWMASHYKAPEYVSLFPRAGLDGTMKGFLRDTPLQGRAAFKTGSMKGVQSYAGYMLDEKGQPTHVVVMMVNGFRCSRAALKKQLENLLLDTFGSLPVGGFVTTPSEMP